MPTFFEVASEFRALNARIEDHGGEVTSDMDQAFAELPGDMKFKAGHIVRLIRELETKAAMIEGEASAITAEAERVLSHAKAKHNAAQRWKDYLRLGLEMAGIHKLDCGVARLCVNPGRPSIKWEGQGPPPRDFIRTKQELDLQHAQEELAAGRTLPEGFVVETRPFLTIR